MRLQFHRGCWIWWLLLTFGHAQDSVIVFNEIHVQPSSEGSEWIELHNQMAVDVDISGWRLRGGVHYDFPASTVIGGGDYLVIAADPSNPPDIDHVLGPFSGRLDNAGDTLRLEDRSTLGTVPGGLARHRLMDEITYLQGDTEEGITWAKIDPDGGTIPRNNWATSHETGGTPGTTNFPQDAPARTATFSVPGAVVINEIMYRQRPFHAKPAVPGEYENDPLIGLQSSWQFDASGSVPPIDWQSSASLDWPSRSAPFGIGLDSPPVTVQTPLPLSSETSSYVNAHYFRQTFEFAGDPSEIHDLSLHSYVDDGAVIYVNGTEIHRVNLPEGPITERTSALDDEGAPDLLTISGIDPSLLRVGVNQLAVALHQKFTLFVKSDDAIFAAEMFARRATKAPIPAEPHRESDEEWIELHNRSTQEVDLSGWRLQDEIDHLFPEGTFIAPGGYLVVDSFQGTLSNSGARLALHDSQDQIVDEVHYRDNGRWPKTADGYGASLELRNPHADNRIAEAWAASNEQPHATWQTYSYEGVAEDDGIGTRLYHELVIGMLDAGEILLDDVSVIQDPHGAAIELMQNGDFEQGAIQEVPNHWLAVGTHGSHGQTILIDDPDAPGNQVLHLVTTGASEDKHNQLTSVYADSARIQLGATYRISFRAKWLSGSNQLNTRLYFNYLQRTTRLTVPESGGTPGAPNSTHVTDFGPTLEALSQSPVLPMPQQPVDVRIQVSDPEGIEKVQLTYAINGGTLFTGGTHTITMESEGSGIYKATIPGRPAGDLVRVHVTATDALGNLNQYPREGPNARAMYEVVADASLEDGPHRFRILMEKNDREFLFNDAIRMSNDRIRGTVIYKDIAYYNVGIRLKGSAWARNNNPYQGLNIRFDSEHPFRGVHETVALERDPGKGEILAHHLFYAAGGMLPSYYNDVVALDFEQASFSGPVLLLMARTSRPLLKGTFDNASAGTVYNLELLYTPQATIGRQPEAPKQPFPYTHDNGRYDFRVMGRDKEAYRWGFQIRSNRDRDHYEPILRAAEAFASDGSQLESAAEAAMDVDQWARAFAMMALNGNDDFYSRLWEHNFRLYHRPEDGRLLAIPWDFDRAWRLSATSPLIGKLNNQGSEVNLAKLFESTNNLRRFHSHLHDLLESVYNPDYVDTWAKHYGALFRSNLGSVTSYVRSRANYARGQLPIESPFLITTNGGADFTIDRNFVSLTGRGWINVSQIRLQGQAAPLPLEWRGSDSWRTTIPVNAGTHPITLVAYDMRGREIGTAAITITSTANEVLATAENLSISEIHYHPAKASEEELADGFEDEKAFEFIELWNQDTTERVELNGVQFASGVRLEFTETVLEPGERAVIVAHTEAFVRRYGDQLRILGRYRGQLNNGGERIQLIAANGSVIADIDYDDRAPWPIEANGQGPSIVFHTDSQQWSASLAPGGHPGVEGMSNAETITYFEWKTAQEVTDDFADDDGDGLVALQEYAFGGKLNHDSIHLLPTITIDPDQPKIILTITRRSTANDVSLTIESSTDLQQWVPDTSFESVGSESVENGLVSQIYRHTLDSKLPKGHLRIRVTIANP